MEPKLRDFVESLEAKVGPDAVIQILQDGLARHWERMRATGRALTFEGGTLAQRVEAIARSVNPDACLKFVQGEGQLTIEILGVPSEVVTEIRTEINRLLAETPGAEKHASFTVVPFERPVEQE